MARYPLFLSTLGVLLLWVAKGALSATFTFNNNCEHTVWPGILSNAGTAPLGTTGFALQKGESRNVDAPAAWSGRLWGRTFCTASSATGAFTCGTGDCGSGRVECSGGGAAPPATLAEFTLDGSGGKDFYDVSLVDGYNLPMLVAPQGGGGSCSATGCLVDLNGLCPSDLRVVGASSDASSGSAVACRSACEAFGSPQYCCSGAYGNPDTCKPSSYSQFFKNACPRAYSYAYDDATSTFTCASAGAGYTITFCPSTARSVCIYEPLGSLIGRSKCCLRFTDPIRVRLFPCLLLQPEIGGRESGGGSGAAAGQRHDGVPERAGGQPGLPGFATRHPTPNLHRCPRGVVAVAAAALKLLACRPACASKIGSYGRARSWPVVGPTTHEMPVLSLIPRGEDSRIHWR